MNSLLVCGFMHVWCFASYFHPHIKGLYGFVFFSLFLFFKKEKHGIQRRKYVSLSCFYFCFFKTNFIILGKSESEIFALNFFKSGFSLFSSQLLFYPLLPSVLSPLPNYTSSLGLIGHLCLMPSYFLFPAMSLAPSPSLTLIASHVAGPRCKKGKSESNMFFVNRNLKKIEIEFLFPDSFKRKVTTMPNAA